MQTNKLIIAVLAAGFAGMPGIVGLSGPALAFDPDATPVEAFREGYLAYKEGDTENALAGLNFAAEKGHRAALWKLGQMYAIGDGVAKDDRKAFEYFSRIAENYGDGNPYTRDSRYISRSIVALGGYYQTGIADAMPADPVRARRFFRYAASYYFDAEAQYRLAGMYLSGQGGDENARQAARWYKLAARKGYAPAQAMFGRLLLDGLGVRRNTVYGLMWLSIAQQKRKSDSEIQLHHEQAFAAASETERTIALEMKQEWLEQQN